MLSILVEIAQGSGVVSDQSEQTEKDLKGVAGLFFRVQMVLRTFYLCCRKVSSSFKDFQFLKNLLYFSGSISHVQEFDVE